jgi:hypothetical protein
MDRTDSRLAPSPEPASDDAASPFDIEPGEAADRLAFDPVPLRYRSDGLTPARQREYVEALADTGLAREAAARVGVSEQAIARIRRRADARDFDRACEAAHIVGARRLRSIAFERAIEGTLKGHYYHGELVSQERVHDNRLLIYLLGKTEHLLDPPGEARAVCGNWQPYMEALEQGLPPPEPAAAEAPAPAPAVGDPLPIADKGDDSQVWLEDGRWWTVFPPPDGFDGEEEGELGASDYQRTLTQEEEAVMRSRVRKEDRAELDRCCAVRDRFFGLPPRGSLWSSQAQKAETTETTETSGPSADPGAGQAPLEFKSAMPPCPTRATPLRPDGFLPLPPPPPYIVPNPEEPAKCPKPISSPPPEPPAAAAAAPSRTGIPPTWPPRCSTPSSPGPASIRPWSRT